MNKRLGSWQTIGKISRRDTEMRRLRGRCARGVGAGGNKKPAPVRQGRACLWLLLSLAYLGAFATLDHHQATEADQRQRGRLGHFDDLHTGDRGTVGPDT